MAKSSLSPSFGRRANRQDGPSLVARPACILIFCGTLLFRSIMGYGRFKQPASHISKQRVPIADGAQEPSSSDTSMLLAPAMPSSTSPERRASIAPSHKSLSNIVDLSSEALRGVPLSSLLANAGALFADAGAAARQDPAGTYALSRPVRRLSNFISHSWSASRSQKWLALLWYYNGTATNITALLVMLASFYVAVLSFEAVVPSALLTEASVSYYDATPLRYSYFVQTMWVPIAWLVLLGAHKCWRTETAFVEYPNF